MVLLIQTFPLHPCNLPLVIGDDFQQSGVEVGFLIWQEFPFLEDRKENSFKMTGRTGISEKAVTPPLTSFPGTRSFSALRCLCADFWAAYQQTVSPKNRCRNTNNITHFCFLQQAWQKSFSPHCLKITSFLLCFIWSWNLWCARSCSALMRLVSSLSFTWWSASIFSIVCFWCFSRFSSSMS